MWLVAWKIQSPLAYTEMLFNSPEEVVKYAKQNNIESFSVRLIKVYEPSKTGERRDKIVEPTPLSR